MSKGNLKEVRKKAGQYILISILIAMPITAIMFLYPNEIMSLLFPNAQNGAMYLKISSISIIFMILAQTINGILQGIGKVSIPAIAFGIGMIIKFICNIILISNPKIGIYGAIIGNIMCNIIACMISIVVLYKSINLRINLKNTIVKPIIATLIMSTISLYLYKALKCIKIGYLEIIITFLASFIIYLLQILIFKIYHFEKIKKILK